jgi:hypothetical protein
LGQLLTDSNPRQQNELIYYAIPPASPFGNAYRETLGPAMQELSRVNNTYQQAKADLEHAINTNAALSEINKFKNDYATAIQNLTGQLDQMNTALYGQLAEVNTFANSIATKTDAELRQWLADHNYPMGPSDSAGLRGYMGECAELEKARLQLAAERSKLQKVVEDTQAMYTVGTEEPIPQLTYSTDSNNSTILVSINEGGKTLSLVKNEHILTHDEDFPSYKNQLTGETITFSDVLNGFISYSDYQKKIGIFTTDDIASALKQEPTDTTTVEGVKTSYKKVTAADIPGVIKMNFDEKKGQLETLTIPSPGYPMPESSTINGNVTSQVTITDLVSVKQKGLVAYVKQRGVDTVDMAKEIAMTNGLELDKKQKALTELKMETISTSSDSVTLIIHGIGMPLVKGQIDPVTQKGSSFSWESFTQGAFFNKNEMLDMIRWNQGSDSIPGSPVGSLIYYFMHRDEILNQARKHLIAAIKSGKKINIIGHSLGALIMYELLKEAETEGKGIFSKNDVTKKYILGGNFTVNKFIMLGSVVKIFHKDQEIMFEKDKVQKFVNVWSTKDSIGVLYGMSITLLKQALEGLLKSFVVTELAKQIIEKALAIIMDIEINDKCGISQ